MAIISLEELVNLRGKVAMVDGGFDPLHAGHIAYFKAAASLGVPVLCCAASDRYIGTKHRPLLPQAARITVIDAIRYIDYVCVNETTTADILAQLRPRYYVKGKDWENRLPPTETTVCAEYGIKIRYMDTMLDSSSRILKDYLNQ